MVIIKCAEKTLVEKLAECSKWSLPNDLYLIKYKIRNIYEFN